MRKISSDWLKKLESGKRSEKQIKKHLKNSIFGFTADLVYDSYEKIAGIRDRIRENPSVYRI